MKLRPMTKQDLEAVAAIQTRIIRAPVSESWREMPARQVGDLGKPGDGSSHGDYLDDLF